MGGAGLKVCTHSECYPSRSGKHSGGGGGGGHISPKWGESVSRSSIHPHNAWFAARFEGVQPREWERAQSPRKSPTLGSDRLVVPVSLFRAEGPTLSMLFSGGLPAPPR